MALLFLLEDDLALGSNLKLYLESNGYAVFWARDLHTARASLKEKDPDLYVLDWTLPDGTGFEFMKSDLMRKNAPVFFLTGQESEEAAIRALSEGAHDYLRKPFGQGELIVKIKKALREAVHPSQKLRFGDLLLDEQARNVSYRGSNLALRRREFDFLKLLMEKADQVVRREELLEHVDDEGVLLDRTIDSHISRLRKAFQSASADDIELLSVYGEGYRLTRKKGIK